MTTTQEIAPKVNDKVVLHVRFMEGWTGVITEIIPTEYPAPLYRIKLDTHPSSVVHSDHAFTVTKRGELEGQGTLL